MKKTLSLFLSLALLFSLAACGPKETQAPTSSASSPLRMYPSPAFRNRRPVPRSI